MKPVINDVMLAISSSLAASIIVKVTVTLALGLIGAWLARRSRAAIRHALLAAAFGVLFVLPIVSILAPPLRIAVPAVTQEQTVSTVTWFTEPIPGGPTVTSPGITPVLSRWSGLSLSALLTGFWIAGMTLFLLLVFAGLWQVRVLRRSGLPWRRGQSVAEMVAVELGIHRQRFARGVEPDRDQLNAVMVRRLKSEIENWDGSPLFPKRELEALEVDYPDEEKAVHAALQSYTRSRRENATSRAETFATEFVLKLLKKRLFSSAAAFASTLAQHERSLRESRKRTAGQPKIQEAALLRDIDRAEEDYADDAEMESAADDALQTASLLFRPATADEERLLQQMRNWATTASARSDAKAAALVDWLKNYIRPNGVWSSERVIIFTEYRATQNWLQTILVAHGLAGGDRLLTLNGSTDLKERERVKAAFQYDPALSPVRILLATDAASEGIDLQNHCSRLIHNEIPWNPNRMEQRNGRIDRHGQRAKEVNIYHFVAKGYKRRQQNASIPSETSKLISSS